MEDLLPPIEEVPAAHLSGRVTSTGWIIGQRIQKDPGASGGHFSISYEVENAAGEQAFLKALNFQAAALGPGSIVDRLNAFTTAYIFERDVLAECGERRMSRIIRMLDHGTVAIPGAPPILEEVPYLIFERADGDIRSLQAQMNTLDLVWAFRVLKHCCEGLEQLHAAHTAHQDLKPSNVLTTDLGYEMKLGDLGRAERRVGGGPWADLPIPGAVAYAPPEQLYGAFGHTWEERRAADMYLAGSLACQLFLGHCLSVLVQQALGRQFRFDAWQGDFSQVLPYLRNAHATVLAQLEADVRTRLKEDRPAAEFIAGVAQLTDPDPSLRGHPKDRAARTSSYAMRRFVSLYNRLARETQGRLGP